MRLTRRAIVLISFGTALLAAVFVAASSTLRTKLAATHATVCGHGASLEMDRVVLDLGEVEAGPALTACFNARNTGGRRLILHRQSSDSGCDCLRAEHLLLIPPGEQQQILLKLDTRDVAGPLRLKQSYRTNDRRFAELELEVLATVRQGVGEAGARGPESIEPIPMQLPSIAGLGSP